MFPWDYESSCAENPAVCNCEPWNIVFAFDTSETVRRSTTKPKVDMEKIQRKYIEAFLTMTRKFEGPSYPEMQYSMVPFASEVSTYILNEPNIDSFEQQAGWNNTLREYNQHPYVGRNQGWTKPRRIYEDPSILPAVRSGAPENNRTLIILMSDGKPENENPRVSELSLTINAVKKYKQDMAQYNPNHITHTHCLFMRFDEKAQSFWIDTNVCDSKQMISTVRGVKVEKLEENLDFWNQFMANSCVTAPPSPTFPFLDVSIPVSMPTPAPQSASPTQSPTPLLGDFITPVSTPTPAPTGIQPIDCAGRHGQPIQVYETDDGYTAAQMNHMTADYTTLFSLPFNLTTPAFKWFNAAGINPADGIGYGVIKMRGGDYIVRFDTSKVEYIAKFAFAPAGTFDDQGTLILYRSDLVYEFPDIAAAIGHANRGDAPNWTRISYNKRKLLKAHQMKDLVFIEGDFENTGSTSRYIVGQADDTIIVNLETGTELVLASYYDDNTRVTVSDGLWGAGWRYNGEIYFASNEGTGVFRVDIVDSGTSRLIRNEFSQQLETHENDGFQCP